ALSSLFETAATEERALLLDALAPIPLRRRGASIEENKALQAAVDAALASKAGVSDLQEVRLRAAYLGDDDRFAKALDAYADSVADAGALSRAAVLALQRNTPEPGMAAPNWGTIRAAAEKVASKAPASAPAALLAGLALHGAGEKDSALKRLEDALGGLEKEPPSAALASAEFLTPLARAFADAGREEALVKTCRLFVATVNRTPRPWRLLRGAQDPLGICLGSLVGKARYVEAFQVIKELDRQKITYLHSLRPALRSSEQAFVKAAKDHVLKNSKDAADFRKLAALVQLLLGRSEEAVELLEKACAMAPGDVELMYEFATVCVGSRDSERAVKAFEDVLAGLEKTPTEKVDRNTVLFQLAQLHGRAARHDKAVAALDKLDLDAPNVAYQLV
ncbi:MAG: tetratricopeptide repeat protein, partial [Candidatus Rokuibacteriota bacterium]